MAAIGMLGVTENDLIPKWTPAKGEAQLEGSLLWALVEFAFDSI